MNNDEERYDDKRARIFQMPAAERLRASFHADTAWREAMADYWDVKRA